MAFAASRSPLSRRVSVSALFLLLGCAEAVYNLSSGIEAAWLYGNLNEYAYYFTDLLVGSPHPQRASVIIDTGSRLVGFPCKGCPHCGKHLDPSYDFSTSKSNAWLDCSECPGSCTSGQCTYSETYSEGSSIAGVFFSDMVELGEPFEKNPPVRAHLGCHTNENNLFYTQRANGIMGLAPSDAYGGQPTVLQDLFKDKKHVDTTIFSICLATWGGRLVVGGFNASSHTGPAISWVPMVVGHYYSVKLNGLRLGDSVIAMDRAVFGETIVDSGTTYTYLPSRVFSAMVNGITNYCQQHNGCRATRKGSDCWRLSDGWLSFPTAFPVLQMQFEGGAMWDWSPLSYLHQRGEPDVWCQTFMENNMLQTVLGISWMLHKDVIFDVGQRRLGLAAANCPEHRKLPEDVHAFTSAVGKVAIGGIQITSNLQTWNLSASSIAASACLLAALLIVIGQAIVISRSRIRQMSSENTAAIQCLPDTQVEDQA